jgi:hypothetical protein
MSRKSSIRTITALHAQPVYLHVGLKLKPLELGSRLEGHYRKSAICDYSLQQQARTAFVGIL